MVSYADIRDEHLRVNLTKYQDFRHEKIDFQKNGEYFVFCVGSASRDSSNYTRIVLFSLAKISGITLKYDSTDNVAFVKALTRKDILRNDQAATNFKSFIFNLSLMFVNKNFGTLLESDLPIVFPANANIPDLSEIQR